MRGKPLADRIRAGVAEQVRALGHIGLVTVLVGDDPASEVYIRLKHKAANEAGFDATDLRLPEDTSEDELLARIAELNASDDVDAILVQLPLPAHIDEERVIRTIAPAKDVDGLHPLNAGELYLGRPAIVLGDTARRDGAARRAWRRARRRPRRRRRAQRDRRQADGAPSAAGERHRHRVPFAHA